MALVSQTQRPIVSDDNFALIIYMLYGAGYFIGISALVGVIMAYVKIEDADPVHHVGERAQADRQSPVLAVRVIGRPRCGLAAIERAAA